MLIDLPYGTENKTIRIDEPVELVVPNRPDIKDEDKIIEEALKNPIDADPFIKFVKKSDKLLIIVNDATRPTPTAKILQHIFPIISKHTDLKFLIATGVHREPNEQEYKFIFGRTYEFFKNQIYAHNARDKKSMEFLGLSKNGTEMHINKLITEYRNVVAIGSVEPHYFAGYTGGRKSFLPGVASYKTIEMNHKLALSDKASSLILEDNPVNEDMVDAMSVLKNINVFSIQTVLTGDHKIYSVTSGDLDKSFQAAITYSNDIFCVNLRKKGNIVITVAPYPMDVDLYQSQKALDNGKIALEDNGIIIMVSKCRTGIGEESFLDLLDQAETCKEIFEIIKNEYKLGYHKAAKMAQIGIKAEMWAVTDLDNKIIEKALLKPYSDIQTAVNDAIKTIKNRGEKPRIIVMPFGSLTVPTLGGKT